MIPEGAGQKAGEGKPGRAKVSIDWAFLIVAALSIGSATTVLLREGWGVFTAILTDDLWLFAGVLPKVLAGCLIGALVRILIPRELVVRHVGAGSGVRGLVIATFVGAVFPGGPFTIFPLAAGFLLSGADRGAAVAFVTGWLLLGLNRAIVWEMPFLGYHFVGYRMLISVPMPVMAGLLARSIPAHWLPLPPPPPPFGGPPPEGPPTGGPPK